jgi:hypothetical protein
MQLIERRSSPKLQGAPHDTYSRAVILVGLLSIEVYCTFCGEIATRCSQPPGMVDLEALWRLFAWQMYTQGRNYSDNAAYLPSDQQYQVRGGSIGDALYGSFFPASID